MRSRYSANVLNLANYLNQSWHPSTRPDAITTADFNGLKWLRLEIVETQTLSPNQAQVEFKAKFKSGKGKTLTLHETSQFILEHGHWFYVDGEIHAG